jgi:LysR family pca operon transcriptional activator
MGGMIDQRIKFRHLQTFVEVARQKSVMKAAEMLHVSQPAVTKTIRELEDALGVRVLERDGRGIRVTRLGEVFLRHAGAAISALRQGVDSIAADGLGNADPVRIGALPTVSTRIMPRAMALFLGENTGSRVKIVTGENAVLLGQLRVGDLDIVVGRLAAPEQMTGFSFEHLYSEEVRFVVRAGHPLLARGAFDFADLTRYVALMPTRTSIIRPFVERLLIANGVPSWPTQIETVSHAFGRAFVRSNDAVWVISEGVVTADVEDGVLAILPIDTSETKGPVGLTIRADQQPTLALSLLMQTLREAARELSQ